MYQCSSKDLSTETCEFATEDDLKSGEEVIWRFRGVAYTAKVVEVCGKWMLAPFQ